MTNALNFTCPLDLDKRVVDAMRQYAKEKWPQECCGVIANNTFMPAYNMAPDPENQFLIDPVDWLNINEHMHIQAIVHSHCGPNHPFAPSELDMKHQIESALPWAIIYAQKDYAAKPLWWGDFRLKEPLLERPFIHGVLDCYAAIRAYYFQERGAIIPDFARDYEWWLHGGNLYADNFAKAGFRVVDKDEVQVGDGLLIKLRGKIIHHAAIYLGNDQIYHHYAGRTSCQDMWNRWHKFVAHVVRYDPVGVLGHA